MTPDERLREHPKDRLAVPVQHIDLQASAAQLRAEPHPAVSGHRQLALVKRGPLSLILFAFDKEGLLKEHQADGEVIIHVLRGRLEVTVEGETVALTAGALLGLAPGERHAVRATEESDVLVSIATMKG